MTRETTLVQRLVRTHLFMALLTLLALWSLAAFLAWIPLLRVATTDFSTIIVEDIKALSASGPEQRESFSRRMADEHKLVLLQAIPLSKPEKPLFFPYLIVMENVLGEKLGQNITIQRVLYPGLDYAFAVNTPTGQLWLGFSHDRIGTAPVLTLSAMFAFVILIAVLGAWLLARWLAHPLHILRQNAQRLAANQDKLIPADSRVKELNDLASACNTLAESLRRMVEQRSVLLAGIAHDLRSPMARMELALELARVTANPARLARIADDLSEMRHLIDSYVDFTAGCSNRRLEPVMLNSHISAWLKVRGGDIPLELDARAEAAFFINRQALERILGNLIDNALKHGRPPYVLRTRVLEDGVRIELENAGEPLTEAQCKDAFEPFTRLDPSRNPQCPGSGLGLSIVRDIAAANGWRTGLTPRMGGGAVAWLELSPTESGTCPDSVDENQSLL